MEWGLPCLLPRGERDLLGRWGEMNEREATRENEKERERKMSG
jgi:hypothetical protein